MVSFNKQKLMETLWEFFQGDINIWIQNEFLCVHWLIQFCESSRTARTSRVSLLM